MKKLYKLKIIWQSCKFIFNWNCFVGFLVRIFLYYLYKIISLNTFCCLFKYKIIYVYMVYMFSWTKPCDFWLCIALKQNVPYTIKQLITHRHTYTLTYTIKLQIQWQHVKNKLQYITNCCKCKKKIKLNFSMLWKLLLDARKLWAWAEKIQIGIGNILVDLLGTYTYIKIYVLRALDCM